MNVIVINICHKCHEYSIGTDDDWIMAAKNHLESPLILLEVGKEVSLNLNRESIYVHVLQRKSRQNYVLIQQLLINLLEML